MDKIKQLGAAYLLVCMATTAHADNFTDTRWYADVFGSFVGADSHRGGNGGGGGLGVGKIIDEHFNVELKGFGYLLGTNYIDAGSVGQNHCTYGNGISGIGVGGSSCYTDNGKRADLTQGGGMAEVQYYFARGTLSPYTVLGAGIMTTHKHVGNADALGFVAEAGLGLNYAFSDHFALRGDIRYRYNNNFNNRLLLGTDEFHDYTVNLGLVYVFGDNHH